MGRKKIEIRPLVDERNRNVTFLKRKAGLMKKAWELSVLCAADVSILIFSNSGKPYEFSSRELDGELDRYLEYEGMIERRRAPEFAAAAAAGEDDDDDDDENDRRGSIKGKQGGPPGPGKSLKGKESFKARQPSRSDYAKAKRRRRDRTRDGSERRGFIEGLMSHPSSDEDDDEKPIVTPHDRIRHDSDMSSMAYAMNLHQSSSYPPQSSARLSYPPQTYRDQPLQPSYSGYNQQQPSYASQPPSQPSYQSAYPPPASQPPSNNFMPNNMQWDQDMLSRYAEFQLQQNHQRQQRILLERQRHQLAELGIPVDDSGLLDQLFAGGVPPAPPPQASSSHSHTQSHGTPQGDDTDSSGFIWPTTAPSRAPPAHHARSSLPVSEAAPAPNGMLDHLYTMGRDGGGSAAREGDDAGFSWPTGSQQFLPSPDSAEGIVDKKRLGSPYYAADGMREDKRARVY